MSRQEAARFLTQATFGPTEEDVAQLQATSKLAWLQAQFAMAPSVQHLTLGPDGMPKDPQLQHSFWRHTLTGPDQLRQRMAYALSQIFVVSAKDSCGSNAWQGLASYHDMLLNHAFGSYRDLLQAVTLHPMMGCYLSHVRNRKEDPSTGRVPDENYAREVMQLFSIGLVELNKDGTPKTGDNGVPIETYSAADVSGLAKVFTGWSWDCPQYPSENCFQDGGGHPKEPPDPWVVPMVPYERFHSDSEKNFLGVRIPSQWFPAPQRDLKIALDRLASHPNVGPFIGKQIIQRLVTSNPSPAYVARVSQAFDQNKGSLQAMLQAVLMDPEAQNPAPDSPAAQGKVKEPILRMSAFMRAFHATSETGRFTIGPTDEAALGLNQSPYFAPSVFNFYRPSYKPPGSMADARQMVAPELQIANETSMAGYAQYMNILVWAGMGDHVKHRHKVVNPADVKMDYQLDDGGPWLSPGWSAETLITQIDHRLMFDTMSPALRKDLLAAIAEPDRDMRQAQGSDSVAHHARRRLWSALLLTVISPEYCVQR